MTNIAVQNAQLGTVQYKGGCSKVSCIEHNPVYGQYTLFSFRNKFGIDPCFKKQQNK